MSDRVQEIYREVDRVVHDWFYKNCNGQIGLKTELTNLFLRLEHEDRPDYLQVTTWKQKNGTELKLTIGNTCGTSLCGHHNTVVPQYMKCEHPLCPENR